MSQEIANVNNNKLTLNEVVQDSKEFGIKIFNALVRPDHKVEKISWRGDLID